MRNAEIINIVYFSFITLLALTWRLPRRWRIRAIALGFAGLAGTAAALAAGEVLRDWLPVPLMAAAYWQSGCFFHNPNPKLQARFDRWDEKVLRILPIRRSDFLELAYVLCYPVVPLGLAALYWAGAGAQADYYWQVVLLSAYPCYAALPFVQLLPPRSLSGRAPAGRPSKLRQFNLWIVGKVTHQATTFPSGHVAASTAIALVLLRIAPPAGIPFALIAAGIALGCIAGRYHYAVDVGAAILLSAAIFAIVNP